MLINTDELSSQWDQHSSHTDIAGDPLGDNKIIYVNEDDKAIVLKLKTATSVAGGILDQYDLGPYDLIVLGSSGTSGGFAKNLWDPAIAEKVAIHAQCSVCICRELEIGHGMLLCSDGSEKAYEMIRKSVLLSRRVGAEISIMSVALDNDYKKEAQSNVDGALELMKEMGVEPIKAFIKVGNPVEEIIKAGPSYSFIVVGDTGRTGLKRFFMGSVAFKVMEYAKNSVMIIR